MMHLAAILIALFVSVVSAGSKTKPHGHQGVLEPYDGKPLPLKLTADQQKKLDNGDSVLYNERNGKSGRGVVIQDINASVAICMDKIRDLPQYPKMVPHVKKVEIYESSKFMNGTSKTGAAFNVGLMGLSFQYFLLLTHEPKYNTLTWTLDYKYNSDFDDNCGHWQVMQHPSKRGWSRILYSCKIKLFSWIPEFVVNFLTSKALVESTSWVKRESELEAAKSASKAGAGDAKFAMPSWFDMKGGAINLKSSLAAKMAEMERKMQENRTQFKIHPFISNFRLFKR